MSNFKSKTFKNILLMMLYHADINLSLNLLIKLTINAHLGELIFTLKLQIFIFQKFSAHVLIILIKLIKLKIILKIFFKYCKKLRINCLYS